ncbi:hypothetical protein [Rubritalea sp.]|uniref:hypothetical protein n=1 Tax=Rubritalea sp. TaxID=2109375 RepID=UPI003EF99C60
MSKIHYEPLAHPIRNYVENPQVDYSEHFFHFLTEVENRLAETEKYLHISAIESPRGNQTLSLESLPEQHMVKLQLIIKMISVCSTYKQPSYAGLNSDNETTNKRYQKKKKPSNGDVIDSLSPEGNLSHKQDTSLTISNYSSANITEKTTLIERRIKELSLNKKGLTKEQVEIWKKSISRLTKYFNKSKRIDFGEKRNFPHYKHLQVLKQMRSFLDQEIYPSPSELLKASKVQLGANIGKNDITRVSKLIHTEYGLPLLPTSTDQCNVKKILTKNRTEKSDLETLTKNFTNI